MKLKNSYMNTLSKLHVIMSVYVERKVTKDLVQLRNRASCPAVIGAWCYYMYRQVSNISRTLVGNTIVDHSDVVEASPVGAAPITSSFSTYHSASLDWAKTTARWGEEQLSLVIWCISY